MKKFRGIRIRKGKNFLSAGIGRHGPYVVARRNVNRKTGIKATAGTRGATIGADRKITRNTRLGAGYNFTTEKPYGEIKHKKKKFRF